MLLYWLSTCTSTLYNNELIIFFPAQQCPVINVDNKVQVIGDTEEATYGNVVRFSCKFGNEILDGPSELYCNEYGEWSGNTPTCKGTSR